MGIFPTRQRYQLVSLIAVSPTHRLSVWAPYASYLEQPTGGPQSNSPAEHPKFQLPSRHPRPTGLPVISQAELLHHRRKPRKPASSSPRGSGPLHQQQHIYVLSAPPPAAGHLTQRGNTRAADPPPPARRRATSSRSALCRLHINLAHLLADLPSARSRLPQSPSLPSRPLSHRAHS